jgi:hypothetical protein
MDNFRLTQIFQYGESEYPLDEILHLAKIIQPDVNLALIAEMHDRIQGIFLGNDPEFKESTTEYHDLRHTCAVVLATMRMLHGLTLNGHSFSANGVEQAAISSYFHDTGLLITRCDSTAHGASYTKTHEQRSILFMQKYLKGFDKDLTFINDCADIIACTSLRLIPDELSFTSEEVELIGCVVGSADILAQMADRYYLEQLPELFKEKRVGGVNQYPSVEELMLHTKMFYRQNVVTRLEESFRGVSNVMRGHFRERWDIDRDLYRENISKNIEYLKKIIINCDVELDCIQAYLRRTPPPCSTFVRKNSDIALYN